MNTAKSKLFWSIMILGLPAAIGAAMVTALIIVVGDAYTLEQLELYYKIMA